LKASDSHFRFRLDLSYIGTEYDGWQSQVSGRAVQDVLEKALATALRQPVRIAGASRTDAGVHAMHQVATFDFPTSIDLFRLQGSLKGLLPPTIGVRRLEQVDPKFHAIEDAIGKAYRYRFWLDTRRNPFQEPFAWSVSSPCDRSLMEKAAQDLLGEHDFTSFCAADSTAKTKIRLIHDIKWEHDGPICDLWIVGQGFLKQMVRVIAGTLLQIGAGRRPADSIPDILAAKDRIEAGITAPARGLTLMRIFYGRMESWDEIRRSLTW